MTKTDFSQVYLRAENARMSLKQMAQYLQKSSQRLKYSLSVMEKDGLLKDPYCVFDYSYFGLILFRVYFKGGYIGEKDKANIIEELSNNPYIVSIYELTGEFDLMIEFASPNPSKFTKELKKVATVAPTLNDYKIVLNLVTHLYPRHYLTKNTTLQSINAEKIVGGDRERETFNENEMKLMLSLLLNPTIRFTQLAKKSELNVKTAKSIFNNLTKRKIIKGFKYSLDNNKLGINRFRLFIKLHNLTPERENAFKEHMLRTTEISQVNKTVGDWDMELDIESLDKSKIRFIIMRLREEFKDIIERFNLIEFYSCYKRAYLPMYLFREEPPAVQIVDIEQKKEKTNPSSQTL